MPRVVISVALVAVFASWACEAAILISSSKWINSIPAVQTINSGAFIKTCRPCACGISRQTRIVNGDVTSFEEYPWAVQIKYFEDHHCGASLITPSHILTAAHCLHGFQQKYFSVHLADNATYGIKHMKIHQHYDSDSSNNDIAIIELDRPVRLNGPVKTVCLPSESTFSYAGTTGVAIGWGRLGYDEPISEELRKVELPIMSKEQCLQSEYAKDRITDNMFCAGYLEGGRDSCRGDSGGALQVRNERGAMEIVGLVSFGRGCAAPNFPGVYTKVTNYLGWIKENIRNECLCSPPR